MPVLFRIRGFRFFYSNEGSPREPAHIHIDQAGWEVKFWLRPDVHLAYNDGCDARTVRELHKIVTANREQIERAWNEFFA